MVAVYENVHKMKGARKRDIPIHCRAGNRRRKKMIDRKQIKKIPNNEKRLKGSGKVMIL